MKIDKPNKEEKNGDLRLIPHTNNISAEKGKAKVCSNQDITAMNQIAVIVLAFWKIWQEG